MKENKTKPTATSVTAFIAAIADETQRADAKTLAKLMQEITGEKPKMWGPSIVGFGARHYRYASGREGETPLIGFSPRKGTLVLYGLTGAPTAAGLLEKLGTHTTGKGCLYIKKLAAIDPKALKSLITTALESAHSTSA